MRGKKYLKPSLKLRLLGLVSLLLNRRAASSATDVYVAEAQSSHERY